MVFCNRKNLLSSSSRAISSDSNSLFSQTARFRVSSSCLRGIAISFLSYFWHHLPIQRNVLRINMTSCHILSEKVEIVNSFYFFSDFSFKHFLFVLFMPFFLSFIVSFLFSPSIHLSFFFLHFFFFFHSVFLSFNSFFFSFRSSFLSVFVLFPLLSFFHSFFLP